MTASQRVKMLGVFYCELCGGGGSEANPLTAHHADGNPKNNDRTNFMVVHRWRCHTFADWVTQEHMYRGIKQATWAIIKAAYKKCYPLA